MSSELEKKAKEYETTLDALEVAMNDKKIDDPDFKKLHDDFKDIMKDINDLDLLKSELSELRNDVKDCSDLDDNYMREFKSYVQYTRLIKTSDEIEDDIKAIAHAGRLANTRSELYNEYIDAFSSYQDELYEDAIKMAEESIYLDHELLTKRDHDLLVDDEDQARVLRGHLSMGDELNNNATSKSYVKPALITAGVLGVAAVLYLVSCNANTKTKSHTPEDNNSTNLDSSYESSNSSTNSSYDSSSNTSNSKNDSSSTNNSSEESSNIQSNIDETEKMREALLDKGYTEYAVLNMMYNFSNDTLNELVDYPYVKEVEDYAYDEGFILSRIKNYQDARSIYQITTDKAVDYVNRVYEIEKTKFYDGQDKTINDIVAVVKAIDDKNIYTPENGALNQSLHTTFNCIMDNYLFGETTNEDIEKLDALKYLSKDGTDMDRFLSKYADLTKNILANPNKEDNNKGLTDYLYVFATSLNGFTNIDNEEPTRIEDIVKVYGEDFKEASQVNDFHDWFILEQSIIGPMFRLAYTKDGLELDLRVIEAYYYTFDNMEARNASINQLSQQIIEDIKNNEHYDDEQKEYLIEYINSLNLEELLPYIFDVFKIRDLITTAELSPEITALCGKTGYVRTLQGESDGGEE